MSGRAAPFYCPYCGDEDLRPSKEGTAAGERGTWECGACNRAFRLSFLGLLAKGVATPAPQYDNRQGGSST